MPKVLITESYLRDIADAIRRKLDSNETYTPAEMAEAVSSILTGDAVLGKKLIGRNGMFSAIADGMDGYRLVCVDVVPEVAVSTKFTGGLLPGMAAASNGLAVDFQGKAGRENGARIACAGFPGTGRAFCNGFVGDGGLARMPENGCRGGTGKTRCDCRGHPGLAGIQHENPLIGGDAP